MNKKKEHQQKPLDGKVCLVFGGNGDIGGAIAQGLCDAGGIVVPTGRNNTRLRARVKQLAKAGNPWKQVIPTDITKRAEISAVCRAIVKEYKRIDVMVCASGVYLNKPAEKVTQKEWHAVMDVNLHGMFNACQIVGEQMLRQKQGSIITIGSLGSFVALTGTVAYSVSKAGVVAMSNALSAEWAQHGVRVNTLVPGVFPTKLNEKALRQKGRVENILKGIPMKRLGEVNELAGAAVFLASDASQYVTGTSLPVDGGFLSFSGY